MNNPKKENKIMRTCWSKIKLRTQSLIGKILLLWNPVRQQRVICLDEDRLYRRPNFVSDALYNALE